MEMEYQKKTLITVFHLENSASKSIFLQNMSETSIEVGSIDFEQLPSDGTVLSKIKNRFKRKR